jgi:hypothetical protein
MIADHYHKEVCLQAWLHCEDALMVMPETEIFEKAELKRIFHECAGICLGMLNAIKQQSINMDKIALLCIGICVECAEVCEKLPYTLYMKCADACRRCADALTPVAARTVSA